MTYTCPRLTESQRLHFAFQYYLYEVEANPAMEGYLQ